MRMVACVKPPVVRMLGARVIVGVTKPQHSSGPTVAVAPGEGPATVLDEVLASREAPRDFEAALAAAMANERIPIAMREELHEAMRAVQSVSGHAPGLDVETIAGVELGRSSGSRGQTWAQTIVTRGHAGGFAYEVIAASRFISAPRTPGNGTSAIAIVAGEDSVSFGQKLPAGPDRSTVEADVLIFKPDGYKIAIDSKAYSNPFGNSAELREQLAGIKACLREGEVNEFHLASRGRMTSGAKEQIERADAQVRAEILAARSSEPRTVSDLQAAQLDLSKPLICWHEELH